MRDQILESFNHRDFSLMVVGNKFDMVPENLVNSQVYFLLTGTRVQMKRYEFSSKQELKDISTLVRKHWRCGYVECSAK